MNRFADVLNQLFTEKIPIENLKKSHLPMMERATSLGVKDESLVSAPNKLRGLFGKSGECFSDGIGTHPDFSSLTEDELPRYQYICSVFLDISGSTRLGLKFPLPTVQFYKNAILKSAIEIFQAFDGHIHRLQGDAVLTYFGNKHMPKADAVINALNAASVMQAYNKYTLSEFFTDNGLEPLKIRIGIDFGDERQVLWSKYGVHKTSEITSTSLHTDLAAKLQTRASKNSILIGENVFSLLDLPDEFVMDKTYIKNGQSQNDLHILSHDGINYRMKVFLWEKYLQSFIFLPKEVTNKFIAPQDFQIQCSVDGKNSTEKSHYISNSLAVPKGHGLEFTLVRSGCFGLLPIGSITWKVINRGSEAQNSGHEMEFYMKEFEGNERCIQETAYTGHHYMECSVTDTRGKLIARDRFGIYVNDSNFVFKQIGYTGGELIGR